MKRLNQALGAAIAVCSLAVCQAGERQPPHKGPDPLADTMGPKVLLLEYDHGDVSPWIEFFTFDSRRHPKLLQLRREYRLEDTFDRRWHTVDWTDEKIVPWEKSRHTAWFIRRERLSAWQTSDPEVVCWKPTDRVRMLLCPGPPDRSATRSSASAEDLPSWSPGFSLFLQPEGWTPTKCRSLKAGLQRHSAA